MDSRPQVETVPDALALAGEVFGAEQAVVDGGRALSFEELDAAAGRAARAVIASGVGAGDRVAIWAPNSAEWIIASFGIYAAGAVMVPINTRFKAEEAAHVLRVSGARLLITVTDFPGTDLPGMVTSRRDLPDVQEVVVMRGEPAPGTVAGDAWLAHGDKIDQGAVQERTAQLGWSSTSDIMFTSGTTGVPKGAALSHGASVRTYRVWSELVGLRRGDRYLVVYPFFQTSGLKSGILACVLTGATIVPFPVFDVRGVMDCVAKQRISMLPGPPTVFQSILDHPQFASFDLSSLRLSVTGAASVPAEIVRRMREDLCFETVVTGYGLTETTGTVTMCRHDDPPDVIANTVGRPIPGVELQVVTDGGKPAAGEERGEILVRGFNLMKEYFGDPEATEEAIDEDGWFATGDIGFVDVSGNLHITDRKKDMIITGGFNVYPAELESVMVAHPAVSQVAVIGLPDPRMGEAPHAVVVLRPGQAWDEQQFLSWCKERMANYKVPRSVRVMDALPLNPNGKVMKFVLRRDGVR